VEEARGQLALLEHLPHRLQAALAATDVQVQHSRATREHPADLRLRGDAQELLLARLARAEVADRELPHPDHRFEVHEVTAQGAGQRPRRQVVAAGEAPRRDPLLAQRVHAGEERLHPPRLRVGAERPDYRGHSRRGVARERRLGHASRRSRFAAAAGRVDVAVDQAGDHSRAAEVELLDDELRGHRGRRLSDPEAPLAADQKVSVPELLRRVDGGIA